MAGAKAVSFVMAAFVALAPLMLTAQAPPSGASKADSTVSQNLDAAETNEAAELAQKLTNPLAALISIPIQNWFDFNLGPKKDGFRYTMEAAALLAVVADEKDPDLWRTLHCTAAIPDGLRFVCP